MNRPGYTLHIELSPSRLNVSRITRWMRPVRECVASRTLDGASTNDALQALADVLAGAQCVDMRTTVVLGDEWSRLFMATAPRNAESRGDCDAAVQLRNAQLFGDGAAGWTVRADHHVLHPFLACAMPQTLLDGLRHIGRAQRLTLLSIRPQFVEAWNRWCKRLGPGDWFAVIDAGALSLALLDAGQLVEVRRLAMPPEAGSDATWPVDAVRREALRAGIALPTRLRIAGTVPPAWLAPAGDTLCVPLEHGNGGTGCNGGKGTP